MNRVERRKELQKLLTAIPIHKTYFDELRFTGWQGKVSGLLSFDRKLQSDFQGAVNSIDTQGTASQKLPSAQRAGFTMRNIISQAIGELELPEEPLKETAHMEMKLTELTDQHGGWWFIAHSTNVVRWRLALLAASAGFTILLVGIGIGQIDEVRSLYIQFKNPKCPNQSSLQHNPNRPRNLIMQTIPLRSNRFVEAFQSYPELFTVNEIE